jgi:hypothetical protein
MPNGHGPGRDHHLTSTEPGTISRSVRRRRKVRFRRHVPAWPWAVGTAPGRHLGVIPTGSSAPAQRPPSHPPRRPELVLDHRHLERLIEGGERGSQRQRMPTGAGCVSSRTDTERLAMPDSDPADREEALAAEEAIRAELDRTRAEKPPGRHEGGSGWPGYTAGRQTPTSVRRSGIWPEPSTCAVEAASDTAGAGGPSPTSWTSTDGATSSEVGPRQRPLVSPSSSSRRDGPCGPVATSPGPLRVWRGSQATALLSSPPGPSRGDP